MNPSDLSIALLDHRDLPDPGSQRAWVERRRCENALASLIHDHARGRLAGYRRLPTVIPQQWLGELLSLLGRNRTVEARARDAAPQSWTEDVSPSGAAKLGRTSASDTRLLEAVSLLADHARQIDRLREDNIFLHARLRAATGGRTPAEERSEAGAEALVRTQWEAA